MADKKRGKKRKEEYVDPDEKEKVEKPSIYEYEVAKWLKNNVPTKKTKFLNHNVQYFTGSKAVDALMESKWGTPVKEKEEPFFISREHCVDFLDVMLRHKFFHRARKVLISEEQLRGKKKKEKDKKTDDKDKEKEKEKKPDEKDKERGKKEDELAESSYAEGKGQELGEEDEERKKKKKKIRLEMHLDQFFADSLDAYVWLYDPIPFYYWLFGLLVVLASIGICMFPLWPPSVRMIVYYLSVAAAGFLVFIIALTVIRFIVFCLIWILSLGKHHLWLFPNLTEDVGFFASFWPLYHYEYKDGSTPVSGKKKKKKEKLSDNEEENEDTKKQQPSEPEKELQPKANEGERVGEGGGGEDGSETESESSSQQSQTGKDFEMVDKSEFDQQKAEFEEQLVTSTTTEEK